MWSHNHNQGNAVREGEILRLYDHPVLGQIWLRDDNIPTKSPDGKPIYTLAEQKILKEKEYDSKELLLLNEAKKLFGGRIHAD